MLESGIQQLCFGTGERELNLDHVRSRVEDLQRTIDGLLVEMQQHGVHWSRFLDKMALINLQYVQVLEQLRPALRSYSIYPRHVDSAAMEQAIPELLTSKLLPDMEAQEATLLAHLVGGDTQLTAAPEQVLEAAEGMAQDLRGAVEYLLVAQGGEPGSGVLADKAAGRRACEAVAAQIAREVRQQQQLRATAGTQASIKVAAAVAPNAPKRPKFATQEQLEEQAVSRMAAAAVQSGAVAAPEPDQQDLLLRNLYSGQLYTTLAAEGREQRRRQQEQQATAAAIAARGEAARAQQERALADAAGAAPMEQG